LLFSFAFFFNDTATTEIYTLSLHDALPICQDGAPTSCQVPGVAVSQISQARQNGFPVAGYIALSLYPDAVQNGKDSIAQVNGARSEEHTSELQSLAYLVCRLLLEKKKKIQK